MSDDLVFASACWLAERVGKRQVGALEVVDAHIRHLERVNPTLNAFVTTDFDRARRDARAADERLARGDAARPLEGVPVSVKDAINTAGLRTVAGSRLFTSNVPVSDATAVRRLKAAGAIVLGKTNVPECALDWRTNNPVFGRTNNPWNPAYSPGGSSGGEAAAVAAGCSAGGLGTDLGGSIRVPAHFCGVCGLRPTPGRVSAHGFALPQTGPFTLSHSFGPIARSVEDLALLFAALAGFDPCDPISVVSPVPPVPALDMRELRLAVCADGGVPITQETRQAVERAGQSLARRGAEVTAWALPAIAEVPHVFADWVLQPALPAIISLYRGREDAMGPLVRGLADRWHPPSLERFLDAWSARDAIRRAILDRMGHRCVLIMPVCSTPAFHSNQRGALAVDNGSVEYSTSFAYAELASIAALPALTLPMGRTETGLPVGVQLVGRPFEEPLLLAVARLLEQETGGCQRPPV
jgi:Asp-tRNA(Asn)/Glu-tRNA(Gln) amidotransferase A subunit family amidase